MSDEEDRQDEMQQDMPLEDEQARDDTGDLRLLEAILFATAEPLTPNAIRERMPADADVGGLLMKLQAEYRNRGVVLVDLDGSWAMRTAPDLADSLQINREVQRKMSRSAMETLAIVAYHQPVTRAEIENIRGVATNKGTLDVLMEAGWVKPGRRREAPGRPLTWVTTTAFLDQFGLESLTDLPGLDEMKVSELLDRRPAIDAIPGTRDLFEEEEIASSDEQAYEESEVEPPSEADAGASEAPEAAAEETEAAEHEKEEEEAWG
jgi:segregation and condensation protein B